MRDDTSPPGQVGRSPRVALRTLAGRAMARDPIQHETQLLRDGLRRIDRGEQLDDTPTV